MRLRVSWTASPSLRAGGGLELVARVEQLAAGDAADAVGDVLVGAQAVGALGIG